MSYRQILVSTDGSLHAERTINHAIALAAATGAAIVLLHVIDPEQTEGRVGPIAHEELIDRVYSEARALLHPAERRAESHGVKLVSECVAAPRVAAAIVERARAHQCDLIVMAAHGKNALERLLVGSETQRVLQLSDIPVLVWRE